MSGEEFDFDIDIERKIAALKTSPAQRAPASAGSAPKKEAKYPSRIYTEAEKAEKLVDYNAVPPEQWTTIPIKTHIRYETVHGQFRTGGFVQNHYTIHGKPTIHLETGFNPSIPGYHKWPIVLQDIKSIWAKNDPSAITKTTSSSEIRNLESRIARMETQIAYIINILAKFPKKE